MHICVHACSSMCMYSWRSEECVGSVELKLQVGANLRSSGRVMDVLNNYSSSALSSYSRDLLTRSLVQSLFLLNFSSLKDKHHVLYIGLWSAYDTQHTSGSHYSSWLKNHYIILLFLWIPLSSEIQCGSKGCVEKVTSSNPLVLLKEALALCLWTWSQLALGPNHSSLLRWKLRYFVEFLVFSQYPLTSCGYRIWL